MMLLVLALAGAQETLTLEQAVARALTNYAAVEVSEQQTAAATAGIRLARTAYLPRADFFSQLNRGTRNNIFGLTLPTSMPAISGPPRPENDMASAWGSAVGIVVSWEPFDLGLRRANVAVAEASQRRAEAAVRRTRFEVAASAADAHLTVLAARETVRAARAAVERAQTLEQITAALVRAELRPGADLSRVQAERAAAEAQVVRAEQAVSAARALLARYAGTFDDVARLKDPPVEVAAAGEHPALAEQSAAIEEVKARQTALDKTYAPRFTLEGATFARGTGVNPDGTLRGGAHGLGPNIANYAAGLVVTFPAMARPEIQAQQSVEAARERAEAARLRQLKQDLASQKERAAGDLTAARQLAQLVPAQVSAAQAALSQAQARYKAGLSSVTEVADAQRLLAQAETELALARLAVWRALLHVATADGDLRPFLDAAR